MSAITTATRNASIDDNGDVFCNVCRATEPDPIATPHACPFESDDLAATYVGATASRFTANRWDAEVADTYDVDETWADYRHGRAPHVLPEGCANVGDWLAAVMEADAPHNVWRRDNYAARMGDASVRFSWRDNGVTPDKAWASCSCYGRRYFSDYAAAKGVDAYDSDAQLAWVALFLDHAVTVHGADVFGI